MSVLIVDKIVNADVKGKITLRNFQCLGIAAYVLAEKYCLIYHYEMEDASYITDKSSSVRQIIAMESYILNTLKFRMCDLVSVFTFLDAFYPEFLHSNEKRKEMITRFMDKTVCNSDLGYFFCLFLLNFLNLKQFQQTKG